MPVHLFCNDPTSCKKMLVPTSSSFAAIYHKRHFRKVLTRIFEFGCLSWYNAYVFEKNELDCLIQNLLLNWLALISNPKNEKAKSSYALFHFETNLIKYRSFLFSGPFWTVWKFCKDVQTKKLLCLSSSFLGYLPFIYGQNLDLKFV